VASPKLGGEFDFRLEKRLSKDKMTVLKILGGAWPLAPPGYAYGGGHYCKVIDLQAKKSGKLDM